MGRRSLAGLGLKHHMPPWTNETVSPKQPLYLPIRTQTRQYSSLPMSSLASLTEEIGRGGGGGRISRDPGKAPGGQGLPKSWRVSLRDPPWETLCHHLERKALSPHEELDTGLRSPPVQQLHSLCVPHGHRGSPRGHRPLEKTLFRCPQSLSTFQTTCPACSGRCLHCTQR